MKFELGLAHKPEPPTHELFVFVDDKLIKSQGHRIVGPKVSFLNKG